MKKIFSLFAAVLFAGSMMAATEMTCAEAAAAALAGNTDEVVVEGYVTEIAYAWTEANKNMSFWIADNFADGNVLEAYKCAVETQEEAPEVGDLVKVTGNLAKYNTTPELAAGCTVEIIEKGAVTPPASEADVTILGADFAGQGTANTGSEVSVTKNGVTFNCDKGYSDDAHATLRCYKNGIITITSEEEQIGKLVFKFYSTYTGDLDNEVVVNAKEWTYTLTSQARIEQVEIYFGEVEPIVIELDTITVAEAVEIAKALTPEKGSSAKTEKKYAVKGFARVKDASKKTYYMTDVAGAYSEFLAYQCASIDKEVVDGDFVIVTGKIEHYWGSNDSGEWHNYEISGGVLEHAEAPEGIENIVMTENAQKVVVDGIIYIVRDGKMFNLQGAQVR